MAVCKMMEECSFFRDKMDGMPSTADFLKSRYCREGGHSNCARYVVSEMIGKNNVPHDLLPNQLDRLEEILEE